MVQSSGGQHRIIWPGGQQGTFIAPSAPTIISQSCSGKDQQLITFGLQMNDFNGVRSVHTAGN